MPFDIKPIIDTSPQERSYNLDPGGDWSWLSKQDYSYERSFAATSYHARGAVLGGPTISQLLSEADPHQFSTIPEPPPQTTSVLQGFANSAGGKKIGQLSLNMLDPGQTLAQATGSFWGLEEPLAGPGANKAGGTGFDPGGFLNSKNIDLFGQGETGVPARLADYALALPTALLNKVRGVTSAEPSAHLATSQYQFQDDPNYWKLLGVAQTDDQLMAIARSVTSQYADPSRNQYLVQQLFDTMKHDRDQVLTAITSGDPRVDYMAKWRYASDVAQATQPDNTNLPTIRRQYQVAAGTPVRTAGLAADIVSAIPFVGPQIAAGIAPIDQWVDKGWQGLTPEQRRNYFGNAGIAMAATDFAVTLPLLGGMGRVLAVAKNANGIVGTLYKAYDTTLRTTGMVMASGLIIATSNWALEAMDPGYAAGLGKEIDYARPISQSSLAGVVNELGFWSSGTFGAYPALQLSGRALSVLGRGAEALGAKVTLMGAKELSFFRDVYGGSPTLAELESTGLTGIQTAIRSHFMSSTLNYMERVRRSTIEAIVRGEKSPWDRVNAMDPEQRLEWGNDALARNAAGDQQAAEELIRTLQYGRSPKPILPTEETRAAWDAAHRTGIAADEEHTSMALREFGPDWIASRRMVGTYQRDAMETWARNKVTELGGDASKLGKHDERGWEQVIRVLHQLEYHKVNGEAWAAAEGSAEQGKVAVIASDHLFHDDVSGLRTALDKSLPGYDEAAARDAIVNAIRTKREVAQWYADEWHPKAGVAKRPENVPLDVVDQWLEDVQAALPHRRINAAAGNDTFLQPLNQLQDRLDKQGTWTLAFKPVDEAGNYVSYARTRSGGLLRSPWVEYPLSTPDNLELGNRSLLASKMDEITRGFRTRNLTEFQRANIFRFLTAKADVLPDQIDAFHEGLLALAREDRLPPQTLGTLAKLPELPFAIKTRDQINTLARNIFGEGDLIGHDGKPVQVDWPTVVGKAYRQSFKLNLTAGLTSYLKTMGPVGAAASVASDWVYVAYRFGLSPLFKAGEVLESYMFNGMRGVFRTDPVTAGLFVRGGLGNDGTFLRSEMLYDQMAQALATRGIGSQGTADARVAMSASLMARRLPADFELQRSTASTQGLAEAWQQRHATSGPIPEFATMGETPPPEGPALYDPLHPVGHTVPADFNANAADLAPDYFAGVDLITDPVTDQPIAEMWHATTALGKVYRHGLKSRAQVAAEQARPVQESIAANDILWARSGNSFRAIEAPTKGRAAKGDVKRLAEAQAAYDALPVNGDPIQRRDAYDRLSVLGRKIAEDRAWKVRAVSMTDPAQGVHLINVGHLASVDHGATGEVKWASDIMGLGDMGPGTRVSVTVDRGHAELIADRLRMSARAARNEVTTNEILDHFAATSPDTFGGVDPNYEIARAINGSSEGWQVDPTLDPTAFDARVGSLIRDGRDKYRLVQILDQHAARVQTDMGFTPFEGNIESVGLVGDWEHMRTINPEQIGIVQVAARGGPASTGPDHYEWQYAPENLFTIDDRPALPPISDNQEELIRQLRETLANEPQQIIVGSLGEDMQKLVGENGVKAGLEGRAQAILDRLAGQERTLGDGGPVYRFADLTPRQQDEAIAKVIASGDLVPPANYDPAKPETLGATPEQIDAAWQQFQRRPGETNDMADIAGTSEAFFEHTLPAYAENMAKNGPVDWMKKAGHTLWLPANFKQERALDLQIRLVERDFPALLKASGNDGIIEMFQQLRTKYGLHVAEDRWARWLLEDRQLLDNWLNVRGTPGDETAFKALLDHAGSEKQRGQWDALYQSEDWQTLNALWSINLASARDEAFGVHFFSPYRSALERSLNHPVLGIYPASWALKAAREWARFMFDNRTFGGLRLGMAPAQAIATLAQQQSSTFAQTNDDTLAHFTQKGPLGSTLFIFNLLLPGDWSSLPFPLSRTIREVLRGDTDPAKVLQANLDYMGAMRDARLLSESLGEFHDLFFGKAQKASAKDVVKGVSARGIEDQFAGQQYH